MITSFVGCITIQWTLPRNRFTNGSCHYARHVNSSYPNAKKFNRICLHGRLSWTSIHFEFWVWFDSGWWDIWYIWCWNGTPSGRSTKLSTITQVSFRKGCSDVPVVMLHIQGWKQAFREKNIVNSLINTPGAMTSPQGIHPSCRGHFHLPEAFYGMKIRQLLAEI